MLEKVEDLASAQQIQTLIYVLGKLNGTFKIPDNQIPDNAKRVLRDVDLDDFQVVRGLTADLQEAYDATNRLMSAQDSLRSENEMIQGQLEDAEEQLRS